MPLKQSVKKKWIAALRSGKYKQGDSALHKGEKYCCLGVLAEVLGAEWKDNGYYLNVPFVDDKLVGAKGSAHGYLSPAFCGLYKKTQVALGSKNDTGLSFKEIADYIEKRL